MLPNRKQYSVSDWFERTAKPSERFIIEPATNEDARPAVAAPPDIMRLEPMGLTKPMLTAPQPVYQPGKYGDMVVQVFTTTANQDLLVLERPKNERIMLFIQQLSGPNLFYTFGNQAVVNQCIEMSPGGKDVYDDVVPQNELHATSIGAAVFVVGYINIDQAVAI